MFCTSADTDKLDNRNLAMGSWSCLCHAFVKIEVACSHKVTDVRKDPRALRTTSSHIGIKLCGFFQNWPMTPKGTHGRVRIYINHTISGCRCICYIHRSIPASSPICTKPGTCQSERRQILQVLHLAYYRGHGKGMW